MMDYLFNVPGQVGTMGEDSARKGDTGEEYSYGNSFNTLWDLIKSFIISCNP